MKHTMAVIKALADENRVRTLMFLRGGELCVCQIIEMLDLAPSTVSKHMTILHQAGLVESRKEGRWVYYRLPGADAAPNISGALSWLEQCLADASQVAADANKLQNVCEIELVELSSRHRQREDT